MSAAVLAALVALGLAAVTVRRTGPAAALVCLQTLVLGVAALWTAVGDDGGHALAASLLLAKALVVSAVVLMVILRVHETRPHDEASGGITRLGIATALIALFVALVPEFGLDSRAAEMTTVALVATALALILTRRAAVFAPLAFLVAENGVGVAAVSTHEGLPLLIEAGIAFDLVLLVAVAAVLQRRILAAFGTTDSSALREIHD